MDPLGDDHRADVELRAARRTAQEEQSVRACSVRTGWLAFGLYRLLDAVVYLSFPKGFLEGGLRAMNSMVSPLVCTAQPTSTCKCGLPVPVYGPGRHRGRRSAWAAAYAHRDQPKRADGRP
jgi:hypothetical protein